MSGTARVWALSTVLVATTALLVHTSLGSVRPVASPVRLPWPVLALVFACAESFVIHIHFRRDANSVALSEIPLVLGLYMTGPEGLVAAQVVGAALSLVFHRRQAPVKLVFNLAHFALEACVAVLIFSWVVGPHDPLGPIGWMATLLATSATCVIGAVAVAMAVSLSRGGHGYGARLPGILAFSLPATLMNSTVALVGVRLAWSDVPSTSLLVVPVVALVIAYRAYSSERQRSERIQFLYESSRAFQQTRGVDFAVRTLLSTTLDMFRAETAELVLFAGGPGTGDVRFTAVRDRPVTVADAGDGDDAVITAVATAAGPPGMLVQRGRPHRSLARVLESRGLHDAMLVGLHGEGGVIGTLMVGNRRGDVSTFDVEDQTLFSTFAAQASAAIENGRLEHELKQLAFHDSLTALANRALLTDRLRAGLRRTHADGQGPAVLFLDLDDFKTVNDSLGHVAGDELLTAVAQRLRICLRPTDTAARLGGDEFAILLDEAGAHDAIAVAERLVSAMRMPFLVHGSEVQIHASIGVVASTRGMASADEVLSSADVAMYRAKERGKGCFEVFEPSMQAAVHERHRLKSELRRALDHGELVVHYQPIVALGSGRIRGVEALVRWNHPQRGLVSPEDFIPLAEETGLVLPIGRAVLEHALRQAAVWQRTHPSLYLAVNLSGRQLQQGGFAAEVEELVRATGVDPGALVLEITESVMVVDDAAIRDCLQQLRRLGVRLAIDDFGTGYSSLSSLRDLPVDILKIAKPFVDGLGRGAQHRAFAAAIVRLGETLRLDMVAEGVERTDQLELLRELHCGMGQGYYFSRPLDADGFTDLLSSREVMGRPEPTIIPFPA